MYKVHILNCYQVEGIGQYRRIQREPHRSSFLSSLVKIQEMNCSNVLITFVEFQVTETIEVEKYLNDIRYNMPDLVEEHNIFVSPYQSAWSKVIGTGSYVFGILVSVIIFKFAKGEIKEQNKTVINMLLVFAYLLVNN